MSFDAGAVVGRMTLAHGDVTKSINAVKKDMGKFGQDAEKQSAKATKGWDKFKAAIKGISFAYAAKKVADFVVGAVKKFAVYEQSMIAVNNALKQHGTSWDELRGKMKAAAAGMISDAELIKRAGQGIALGLDPDQLVEMMKIARASAKIMGEDITTMYESIVTGSARQSKLWLDNLGIIIDVDQAYKDYAKELDKTVDKLDEQERKQAFLNAVLKDGHKIIEMVGGEYGTTAEKMQKFTAAMENIVTVAGWFFIEVLDIGYVIQFWANQLERLGNAMGYVKDQAEDLRYQEELRKAARKREAAKERKAAHSEEHKKRKGIEDREKGKSMTVDLEGGGVFTEDPEDIKEGDEYRRGRVQEMDEAIKQDDADIKAAEEEMAAVEKKRKEGGFKPKKTKAPKSPPRGSGAGSGKSDAEKERDRANEAAERQLDRLQSTYAREFDLIEKHHEDRVDTLKAGALSEEEINEGIALSERQRMEDYRQFAEENLDDMQQWQDRALDQLDNGHAHMMHKMEVEIQDETELRRQKHEAEMIYLEQREEMLRQHYQADIDMIRNSRLSKEEEQELEREHTRRYKQEMEEIQLRRMEQTRKFTEAEEVAARARKEAWKDSALSGAELMIDDLEQLAKVKAGFEIAEGTKEMALFLGTRDPAHLASSLQHFVAAKRYLKSAEGGSSGSGSSGKPGKRKDRDTPDSDEDKYRDRQSLTNLIVNFHGGVLNGDKLQEWMVNEFSPALTEATNSGRIDPSWSQG